MYLMSFISGIIPWIVGLVALSVIGIVIYVIIRRPAGMTIPTALTPSAKTLQNVAWIFASYLLCLWAFSAIWPDAWHAWRGKGFWVTQLLIISVIGMMASKLIKTEHLRWIAWIPGVMAILLTGTSIVNNWPESKHNKDMVDNPIRKAEPEKIREPKVDSVMTVYLKSTDSIVVKNYEGFTLLASTGGTKGKPIPYFRKNGGDWEKYGVGTENLNGSPSFEVWFKGADTTTSTRIWYWYQKI